MWAGTHSKKMKTDTKTFTSNPQARLPRKRGKPCPLTPVIPAIRRPRQEDFCVFQVSPYYKIIMIWGKKTKSKTVWARGIVALGFKNPRALEAEVGGYV